MTSLREAVENRLRDRLPDLREVAGAASIDAVLAGRVATPAVYVFREAQPAGANSGANFISQRVGQKLGVLLAVRNVRDPRQGDSSDEAEALSLLVRDAIFGWAPAEHAEPLEYAGGRLVSMQNGFLFWLDSYTTATYWRAT